MDEETFGMAEESMVLTDEAGRTIACTVERYLEIEDQEYALLLPVDAPIEIFTWEEDADDEDAIPVEDEELIDTLFPIAKAVLEEQNLTLKRTAVVLTVEGELPELDNEEEELTEVLSEDGEAVEELQFLASFYHEEQEYAIYAPLDPCFILARMDDHHLPHLLSDAELETLQPMLAMIEDQLFDEFESA
ncbi:DUF3727 domain-containing protein [Pantanalinema sp. GBBB05]|uniref:DUF3727 domain-containing protein n=1 Tax=Pantanalinema sp. GBBB05 TaxID=2604139 RepID=UPI001D41FFC0|nr:DUF3727 domain-containing protein [Pantanalinema sp. GBBB05]